MRPTLPWESPHPLDAARLRHQRGGECFENVKTALDKFASTHADGWLSATGPAYAYQDTDTGEWTPLIWYRTAPLEVTFEMSEMLYNLKVSLDYATYALFNQALRKGRISQADFDALERFVQFPIMDSPKKLQAWRAKPRKWLRKEEWTVLELAQPYRRPFMRYLGDGYHNLDKHRDLQPLVVDVDLSGACFQDVGLTTAGDDFKTESVPAGTPVYMYAHGSIEVFLDGRTPLVETLQVLQSEVGSLIDAFGLAF